MTYKKEETGSRSPSIADDHTTSASSPPSPASLLSDTPQSTDLPLWRKGLAILTWTPPNCRWDPENPPKFTMSLNLLFAFAAAFTVANLYYNHPILNIFAHDFNVPYETSAQIPTLMQAGYAAGLFFLCPLGDLFKRRPFVISLVLLTATLWIGMCVTTNFTTFRAIAFLTGFTTVTPQLMLPLVGDLAPLNRRATALSIVVSGNLLGMLVARLFSGVLTNYTSWRSIYWFAMGIQYLIGLLLWAFMPDYPSTNPDGLNYFAILAAVPTLPFQHPILAQACLIAYCTAIPFTSFWTTLTFLLSSPPYSLSPLAIGLFALTGIASMFLGPPLARAIIDRFVPLFSVVLGECVCLTGIIIGTYTGRFTLAGPVFQAFFTDLGLQTSQTANRAAIYSVAPKARNRVNTTFMVAVFAGQLTGTAAGNSLYARGGWLASGGLSVATVAMALVFCAARGPWEKGWIGWGGGWGIRKARAEAGTETTEEVDGNAGADETAVEKALDEAAGVVDHSYREEQTKDIEAQGPGNQIEK